MDILNLNIFVVARNTAMVFSVLSVALEIIAEITAIVYVLKNEIESRIKAMTDIFRSGMRVGNSVVIILLFLFFICEEKINDTSCLVAISEVFKIYSICSIAVLLVGIVLTVIIAAKQAKSDSVKAFVNKAWRTGTISVVLGFCLSYILYIP